MELSARHLRLFCPTTERPLYLRVQRVTSGVNKKMPAADILLEIQLRDPTFRASSINPELFRPSPALEVFIADIEIYGAEFAATAYLKEVAPEAIPSLPTTKKG